jgi:hypothetical protein
MLSYDRNKSTPHTSKAVDDYLSDLEHVASAQDLGEKDNWIKVIRPGSNRFPDIDWYIKPAFEN